MKQGQIIFRFLLPPREYATEPVHPTMRPLHNPTTSLESSFMLDSLSFLASCLDMSGITKLFYQITYLTRIIAFIQAHTLRLLLCRLRAVYCDTLNSCLYQFAVMPIRSINRQADRHTRCFGQQTSFDTLFGPVRRVWAGFFPLPAVLWSWHHLWPAKTNRSLSVRHNHPEPTPRVSEKRRLGSTLEIVRGLYCWNKCRSHSTRSTDSRFAGQTVSHSWPCGLGLSACRRQTDGYSDVSAAAARSSAIACLKLCICFLPCVSSSLNPFKGIVAFEISAIQGFLG